MKKRAQITLFIIIGLVLIILMAATYFVLLGGPGLNNIQNVNSDSIIIYLEDCIDQQVEISIFKLGIHGGYMKPKYPYSGEFFDTSYLYYNGENLVPEISDLENSISFFLSESIPEECNFDYFKEFDLNIGDVKAQTKIGDDKIVVDIDWPIEIKLGDDVKSISKFDSSHDIRLIKMQEFVNEIIENNNPKKINVLSLFKPGYNVTIVPDNGNLIYLIKDTNSEVFSESFIFTFATKYE